MALVLIHGSHLTGACWNQVLPHLSAPALAVDLPGRNNKLTDASLLSFADLADSVIADMDAAGITKATLVGHSLAGETLRALALRHPARVEQLVFISALVLAKGERAFDVMGPESKMALAELHTQQQHLFAYPPELANITAHDLDAQQFNTLLKALVPDALALFFEHTATAAWSSDLRCTYIKLLDDVVFPDELQNTFIAALPDPRVLSLAAGHFAMFNKPQALARLLNQISG